jgi:hypothetical protein
MRLRLETLAIVAALAFTGCENPNMRLVSPENQTLDLDGPLLRYPAGPVAAGEGPSSRVEAVVLKNARFDVSLGILSVPVKVVNKRERGVLFPLARAEVEQTDGTRRKRVPLASVPKANAAGLNRVDDVLVKPDDDQVLGLTFGSKEAPLKGDSFRVYLYALDSDGSGVVENAPVVVLGNGAFKEPPAPFSRTPKPEAQPTPAPPAAKTVACPACGAAKPEGATTCPQCGSR